MSGVEITGVHPQANNWPMLSDIDYEHLLEDIATNGLLDPITVTPDGQILDGRNRYKACQQLRLTPSLVIYEGDPGVLVRSRNARRNVSTGQNAMSTAQSLQQSGLRENGRWKRGSVDISGSGNKANEWAQRLAEAGVVLDYMPQLAEAVIAGRMALDAAYKEAKQVKDSAEADKIRQRERRRLEKQEAAEAAARDADIIARLTQAGSKYVALIEQGTMTPVAANAAYLEDTRKQREERQQLERGWRDSLKYIQTSIFYLQGGEAAAEIFLANAYPHERELSSEPMWLTPTRVQGAINYLTTILKGLRP